MSGLAWFGGMLDLAAAATELAAQWFIQSTLVIAAGLAVAAIVRKRNPALLSAVYHTTLVTALVCPLVAQALSQAGLTFVAIKLPSVRSETFEMVPAPAEAEPVAPPPSVPLLPLEPTAELGEPVTEEIAPNQASAEIAFPPSGSLSQSAVAAPAEAAPQIQAVTTPSAPLVSPAPAVLMVRRMVVSTRPYLAALFLGVPLVWGAFSLVLLTRLLVDHWQVARLRRKAVPVDSDTLHLCEATAKRMQVPMPRLLRTPMVTSPCLSGIVRPVILLPEEIDPAALPSVLVHELAHHKRGDCSWNLLRHVGAALLWPQPLIWRLARQMEAAAEDVCDDYVVQYGECRVSYAETLLAIAERNLLPAGEAAVSLVTFRSLLGQRVSRILDPTRRLSLTIGLTALLLVAAGGASAALLAGMLGPERRDFSAAQSEASAATKSDRDRSSANDQAAESVEPDKPSNDDDLVTVSGTVLDPSGKTVAGAAVAVVRWYWGLDDPREPLSTTTTDDSGRFTISYRKSQFGKNFGRPEQWREAAIVATQPGFGPDWTYYQDIPAGESVELRLVADHPIRGRIVDLEGRPVVGASIRVDSVYRNAKEDLSRWIEAVRSGIPFFGSQDYDRPDDSLYVTALSLGKPILTDKDGRFEIPGVGRNRNVNFKLSGGGVAFAALRSVSMSVDSFVVNFGQGPFKNLTTYFGSQFEFSAEPSQPVEGIVRDAKTGQPLAGVHVIADKLAGGKLTGIYAAVTTSDADGRYRLEGLPKGTGNGILAMPGDDLPYFMREFRDVPTGPGLDTVQFDLDLHRGIWITGRMSEKESNRPVRARMFYLPWPDNPSITGLPEFSSGHLHGSQSRYETDLNGRFRLVGLPGRALLGAVCVDRPYPTGQGLREIADLPSREAYSKVVGVFAPTDLHPTAVHPIHPADDAEQIEVDFQIDAGKSLNLQIVDGSGQPVSGVSISGLWPKAISRGPKSIGPSAEVVALKPDERRLVLVHHTERQLGKAIEVGLADAKDGAVSVALERCATLKLRLVNEDHEPVVGALVRCRPVGEADFGLELQAVATDSDGGVSMPALLPGCKYDISAESPQIEQQTLVKGLEVTAGETIDLGEFDPTKEERPPIKRTTSSDVAESASDASAQMVIRGVVVDEENKPIAGANVKFIRGARVDWPKDNPRLVETTDEQGRFAFTLPPGVNAADAKPWPVHGIITKVNGYGLDLYEYGADRAGTEATIRLKRQSPIEGRIVNLEGQPMPGVRVEIEGISVNPTDDLTAWIDALRKELSDAEMEDAWKPIFGFGDSVDRAAYATQTDAEGRFRVLGVAPHQLVLLKVVGGGIVGSRFEVVNVPIDPLPNPKAKQSSYYGPTIYGSKFQLIAEPSQLIEGIVKDADTGAPVAGIKVTSWRMAGTNVGGIDLIEAISDAEGRYRLDGMPRGEGNVVAAAPTGDQPYLACEVEVPAGRELETIKFDLPLHRGVLIRGQLRDKATGEPLTGSVIYLPWPSNPRIKGLPEFSSRRLMGDRQRNNTDKEGRFTVVGLPGRGLLMVRRLESMDYPVGQGFDKLRDPIDEDVFDPIAGFTPSPTQTNAIQDVEIAEDEIDFEANFELEAGDTVLIAAFDTAGKPVEITRAFGLRGGRWGSANYFRGPEPDVTALAKGERRQVTVMNVERGLGATIEVASADGTATRRANLQPLATITGRIVSSDGEPLPSPIQVLSVDKGNSIAFSDVKTDNDGIFRVPVVAAPFGYRMYSPNVRGEVVENLIVAPGETVDLGAIVNGAERPPIKRTPAKADAASSPTAALTVTATTSTTPPESPAEDEPDTFHFTGKVVDPAGNPVAGANILVSYYTTAPLNTLPRATTTPSAVSQADGTFAFSMRKDEFDTTNTDSPWEGAHLVAQKPGLGLGWSHVAANDASGKIREAVWSKSRQQTPELREKLTDSTIRLVADDVPIEGRIVDLEGQPIPGTVVRVVELHANRANNLDAWQKVAENKRADFYASLATLPDGFHGFFLQEQLESLLPAVTTDADGRFRISGIGRERIVRLQIEPPGFETRHVFTRTRPGQTYEISQHADRPNWRKLAYHGANFTHVAAPSQPLVGVVRDKDSGKPLANVSIRAYSLAGEEISGWSNGYIRTVTDAEGRYELKGLPIGESRVISQAPLSEPYLCINSRFEIAADKPTTLDIALKRGVWIRGQVTDADNRAPLRGRIEYFVFNDNPHRKPAGELLRIEDPFYNTGADGKFSVVGLPGRGLISFMASGVDNIYPRGAGADKIIGGREEGQPKVFNTSPHYALEENAHAFVEVNPQADDEAIEANIQLSAGTKIVGAVLDPAGQPLSGYQISGETSMAWFRPINTSEFSVRHLKPGEKRRVLFYHEGQDLAGNLAVDGGDAGPLSVRLEPAGSVQGRIVDDAGLPIADAQIYTGKAKDDVGSGSNVFPDTQKVFTDDDGRFTLKGLAPGVKYSARSGRHGLYLGTIFQNITVASREMKDLGDLNPKSDAELAKSESVEAVTSTPATESGDKPQFEFAGKVLDSDGKPKARASVLLQYYSDNTKKTARATTVADGTFAMHLPCTEFDQESRSARLVVTADGYGLVWESAAVFETSGALLRRLESHPWHGKYVSLAKDRVLRLVEDQALTGRVMTLEGQGVPGATVRVTQIHTDHAEGLKPWLTRLERETLGFEQGWRLLPDSLHAADRHSEEIDQFQTVKSDKEGRFQFAGLGRDRLVGLAVAGVGLESQAIWVRTQAGDILEFATNASEPQGKKVIVYGSQFDHASAPSRPVEGFVRDADSGQPLAGVRVEYATTDSKGHYRLEGLPIGENTITAAPPDDVPYLPGELETEIDATKDVTHLDFQLQRGVWIRGRVSDSRTGQPIRGNIQYFAFADNPAVKSVPGLMRAIVHSHVDADGRYQVVGLPGHGLVTLLASNADDRYPRGAGAESIAGEREGAQKMFRTYPYLAAAINAHYLAEVNLDAGVDAVEHDIALIAGSQRPGRVLDPEGNPLAGVQCAGASIGWEDLETDAFMIRNLEAGQKRRLHFYHEARKLAGSIEVSGNNTDPVVVTLQQAGTITGRIAFDSGDPADRVELNSGSGASNNQSARGIFPRGHHVTDREGRFTISGLAPGLNYTARVSRGPYTLGTAIENVTIAPGETKDLGDLTIVTPQD